MLLAIIYYLIINISVQILLNSSWFPRNSLHRSSCTTRTHHCSKPSLLLVVSVDVLHVFPHMAHMCSVPHRSLSMTLVVRPMLVHVFVRVAEAKTDRFATFVTTVSLGELKCSRNVGS